MRPLRNLRRYFQSLVLGYLIIIALFCLNLLILDSFGGRLTAVFAIDLFELSIQNFLDLQC